MQIPILTGIYADTSPDLRTAYPYNLVPVPKKSGQSAGYLRAAEGMVDAGIGAGADRGGVSWRDRHYRVQGTRLIEVKADGTWVEIGDVGPGGWCQFAIGPTYLAINSGTQLWLYDGTTLAQNTDPDLGAVHSVIWVDGYYMTTDGQYLVVTELTDPFAVDPLKYGSSEVDPDDIKCLIKLRNEVYALNRYSIETFQNTGAAGFPFQRIQGAVIERGPVGQRAACVFMDAIAFLGSARGEQVSVHLGANAQSRKIATREIDAVLAAMPQSDLEQAVLEARSVLGHELLYIHLPTVTIVYDARASQALGVPVWFMLGAGTVTDQRRAYPVKGFVYAHDAWWSARTSDGQIARMSWDTADQFGDSVGWAFATKIIHNNRMGAIVNRVELTALTGHGRDTSIGTQYSEDGVSWSPVAYASAGAAGEYGKRVCWFRQGLIRSMRMQRFFGQTGSMTTILRLDMDIEGLAA